MQFKCLSCGAEVQFKNKTSVFSVCEFCSQVLVRHDLDIQALGKMASLPEDMSVVQIGTQGKFSGKSFQVIGRQKISWEQGYWNEWFVLFEDQRNAWIAEAQGQYSISTLVDNHGIILPPANEFKVGKNFTWKNKRFEVVDIKEAQVQGIQGELPILTYIDRKSVSVDLVGEENNFANVDISLADSKDRKLFLGQYLEFEDFQFTNLRTINGW